jgi:hypothetical protein
MSADLPGRLVEIADLGEWLRALPTGAANYAYAYSEHLSVGDPLPDAAREGVEAKLASEIRKRLNHEWGRQVWGSRD